MRACADGVAHQQRTRACCCYHSIDRDGDATANNDGITTLKLVKANDDTSDANTDATVSAKSNENPTLNNANVDAIANAKDKDTITLNVTNGDNTGNGKDEGTLTLIGTNNNNTNNGKDKGILTLKLAMVHVDAPQRSATAQLDGELWHVVAPSYVSPPPPHYEMGGTPVSRLCVLDHR